MSKRLRGSVEHGEQGHGLLIILSVEMHAPGTPPPTLGFLRSQE